MNPYLAATSSAAEAPLGMYTANWFWNIGERRGRRVIAAASAPNSTSINLSYKSAALWLLKLVLLLLPLLRPLLLLLLLLLMSFDRLRVIRITVAASAVDVDDAMAAHRTSSSIARVLLVVVLLNVDSSADAPKGIFERIRW